MIGIVDYGAGNLRSVKKAMEHLGVRCKIIASQDDFAGVERMILPGVGAFQAAVDRLQETGMYESVKDWLLSDKPFLGICLGMQLLFEESEELIGSRGFSICTGRVIRFNQRKVPQIGWNTVLAKGESRIMHDIKDGSFFYFLHGYYVEAQDDDIVVGTTEYGNVFPSVIHKGNTYSVQFHPEKSGEAGLKLLKNWVEQC